MGAFGVENVRTCIEHSCKKVYVVCRRKNLTMPRVVSWFANQSLYPPQAAQCLRCMQHMYDLIPNALGEYGKEDCWTYYSVVANSDRTKANVRQTSRFGIGDVYYLASYYGLCEVIVDTVKRFQHHLVILENDARIESQHIIKALGFTPDELVDKVFHIKEMFGFHVNSDHKRFLAAEFSGVDAGRFGGTSFSPGALMNSETCTWFLNYPKDFGALLEARDMIPTRKPPKNEGEPPAYVYDARTGSSVFFAHAGLCPGLAEHTEDYPVLNRDRMLGAHPVEQFIDECAAEWHGYCQKFRKLTGNMMEFPDYPYTYDMVRGWMKLNDTEG